MINDILEAYLRNAGFYNLREIPGRGICGLIRMAYTTGLCYGLTDNDWEVYKGRYCYPVRDNAIKDIESWDGVDDPPGQWVKHKGNGEWGNPNFLQRAH